MKLFGKIKTYLKQKHKIVIKQKTFGTINCYIKLTEKKNYLFEE